ncbi:MAG: hypothetical protein K5669_07945 [Lachnospiraceae bacterium]|nr:hypothetical protein [Lachnospiraceae bacterium]
MNEALNSKNRLEGLSLIILLAACLVFRFRIGNIGMGYMLTCFVFYEVMWVVFGERLSEVVGRIIRGKFSKNKFKSARLVQRYSSSMTYFSAVLGAVLIGTVGSYFLKNIFKISHAYYLIWFFAVLFIIRLLSENTGAYLCSRKNSIMIFGAVSVVRQILIAVFGNICISLIGGYGNKVALLYKQEDFSALYSCFAIMFAAIVSELLVLVLLLIVKLLNRKHDHDYEEEYFGRKDNTGNVFIMVWQRRIFEAISTLFIIFPFVSGVLVLYSKSENTYLTTEKIGLFGTSVLIPAILFCIFGYLMLVPLVSEVTGYYRQNKMRYAQNSFQTGIHLSFIYGSFGCIYLVALSNIIASMYNEESKELISKLVVYGGFSALTMLASLFMLRMLIANGLVILTYLVQIPADVIFVVLLNVFVKKSEDVTVAFALALLISFIAKFIGYLVISIIKMEMNFDPIGNMFVPMVVAAVVCVINVFLTKVISPHLGNPFTLLITLFEMALLYLVILLLSRNFKDNEIDYLPLSKFVYNLGQTLRVF